MYGLNVAVVGGGIGGLCAALSLRRAGHHPTVYERTETFRPVGAGISLWSNGIKVLNVLGLGRSIAHLGGTMDRMVYAAKSGRQLTDIDLTPLYDLVGERAWPVSRSDLQDLLCDAVGRERIHTGARCVGVEDDGEEVELSFEGGGTARADLVVAADGTHSVLRAHVLGYPVERRYVGYVNWNGVIDFHADIVGKSTWKTWVGDSKRVSVMPIGGNRLYFFFDAPLSVGEVDSLPPPAAALRELFSGWAEPVAALIERLEGVAVNAVAIHDLAPLPRWYRGRVVLLGDAAHSMAPDLGQGGCQAMEDALVLAHYLTSTNRSVADALDRYERERLPHTADIVRRARERSDITHGVDPARTEAWYRELESEDGDRVRAGLARSVLTGPCR